MRTKRKYFLYFLLPVLLVLLLVSCSPGASPKITPGQATPGSTALAPAATETQSPTATLLAGKVLLIVPADVPAPGGWDVQPVEAALEELSGANGLVFEKRDSLQKEAITPEIKLVVSLDATSNLAEMAAAAPQTQFIAITSTDMPAAGNLSVIRVRLEKQAFVAGFASVLLSNDYRAGGLLPSDGPLGASLQEAFENGASYFCGVCAPGYPLVYYPQVAALPGTSAGPSWQAAAADMFDNQKVEVYYLSAEAARPEVLDYLLGKAQADKPVRVIGDTAPPDILKAQWAATVRFELVSVLRQAWPDMMAGKGGVTLEAALVVENQSPDLFGEGRMRLVNGLITEINAGRVALLSIPR